MPGRISLALILPLMLLVPLSGCGAGDVVDDEKTEIALKYDLLEATGQKVSEVNCPEEVPVRVGTVFQCEVLAESGRKALASVEVISDRADLKVISLKRPE